MAKFLQPDLRLLDLLNSPATPIWPVFPFSPADHAVTDGYTKLVDSGGEPGQIVRRLVTAYGVQSMVEAYLPTQEDIATVQEFSPGTDPLRPCWPAIQAKMISQGHPAALLQNPSIHAVLQLLRSKQQAEPEPPKAKATLDAAAGKIVFLTGKPIRLNRGEKDVLALLVEMGTANLRELEQQHGRPDRVLKRLLEKDARLKKFIFLPGGGGKGGYSTTIEPAQPERGR